MIDWLLDTSIAVTVLMLLVLAVRRPVAHLFGAGWAYALWALPALRLVLPPLHLLGDSVPSLLPARTAAPESAAVAAAPSAETVAAFNWEPILVAAWLAGAAAMILWQASSYLAFTRRLGIGSRVHASFVQEVGVIESPEVDGPLAVGLLDKWIVVPTDFATRYSEREQRLALEHERVHHQREDIFWNMVAIGVLALNWYNPIAYLAFRAFRSDQELSCDAAVAARASVEERHDYALALLKSASRPGLIAACPLNHAGQLKHRLRMIKAHRRSHLRAAGGSGAVAALLLTGISATESPGAAAPEPAPAAGQVESLPPTSPSVPPKLSADAPAPVTPPASPRRDRALSPLGARATEAPRAGPAVPAPKLAAAVPAAPVAPSPRRQPDVESDPDPSAIPAAPASSAAPAAPAPFPARIAIRIDRQAAYEVIAAPAANAPRVFLVRSQLRQGAPMPPEVAARLVKSLAEARHPASPKSFHVIELISRQEN